MISGQHAGSRAPLRVGVCLSLTGRFARFGRQAALGLEAWRGLADSVVLVIEDDESSPGRLAAMLPVVAGRCDVLLGPYSTRLMRAAGPIAADFGWLLWNHGGSGDDVEAAHPGHVVSVLTPATRYAEPFLRHLAGSRPAARLCVVHGRGSFGNQVAAGARATARRLGIEVLPGKPTELGDLPGQWGLLCAGAFEEDVETVRRAQSRPNPPDVICAVAAGVREFGQASADADGIFGVGQWFPGSAGSAGNRHLGPTEAAFLAACAARNPRVPDYPAVQAAAAAVIATHCAGLAGGTDAEELWQAALGLDGRTLFGGFKIDATGMQVGHDGALVRWTADGPVGA
ncbi:MAG: Amino acid/amide transporter substrate-binding protein family [Actinomycetia bacterium]|nr:Amino acid/amide transporter substrate-binding protein family [Actinomycetes bacterium]